MNANPNALVHGSKNTNTSYLLWALMVFGVAGIHRFYLGRPVSGLLYLFTWGFFGIGTLVDLFMMPRLVDEENALEAARRGGFLPGYTAPNVVTPRAALPAGPTSEKQILRLAAARGGVVTPQLVALETSLSLADARTELKKLVESGDCLIDVGEDGSEQFKFVGLAPSNRMLTS